MGVDYTSYVMYGVKMKYKAVEDWDIAQDEYEGSPDAKFDLVCDFMSGRWAIAGKIICNSDKYDDSFEVIDEKIETPTDDRLALVKAINEKLGKSFTLLDFHFYSFVQAS